MQHVTVIGGGLAGGEAAWQVARWGVPVQLFEMRPRRQTPGHRTHQPAERVCSNSLRSDRLETAHGLLKEEMRRLGSLIMEAAAEARVPAGSALAVDRESFAAWLTDAVENSPPTTLRRGAGPSVAEGG